MQDIRIPHPEKKRALFVVDMQAGFLPEEAKWIIPNAKAVIENGRYDLFIEAIFHAEKGSIWDKQLEWTFPIEPTVSDIKNALEGKNPILVTKTTKSVFKGDIDILGLLKKEGIEEVHIIGVDAHDCVLATALESFDAGYPTYVIEECVTSSNGEHLREATIVIMRDVELTNHSSFIKSEKTI